MYLSKLKLKNQPKLKVLEIITLFSIGGATETVISLTSGLQKETFLIDIITGPNIENEGDMYEESKRLGLNVYNLPSLKREIHLFSDIITFLRLYKIIKRGKYSLVHTHSSKAGIIGRWAAKFAGVNNIVHTVHGWSFNESQNNLLRNLIILSERITAPITSKIICVTSLDIEKGLNKKIGYKDKYVVIRSGIDLSKYSNMLVENNIIRKRLNINENEFVIGTITRFSLQKAPLDTILSFNEVIKRGFGNVRLVMVGDGPLLKDAKVLAENLSLCEKIIFTGIRKDIPEILKAFNLFVLTSLWEGLPRVIPQAMAAGIPVIATKIDGNSEIIKNRFNGILVDMKNPARVSEAIIELIKNPDYAAKLVKNAKQSLGEYDEKKMIVDTQNLYNELIKS